MIWKLFSICLLFSLRLCTLQLEEYPTNGQIGEIRFFIPKHKLCRFNISEFNLRFKKCSIPIEYGKSIPHILNGLNKNDFGMRKLYETFCINKEKKELGLFENAEIKANVRELTEKYPITSFQKISCNQNRVENSKTTELEKEISRELGSEEVLKKEVVSSDADIEEVVFTMQPTNEQKKKEIDEQKIDLKIDDNLLDFGLVNEAEKDYWIDDVVGGYFLEDQLDYSHIQDNSFVFHDNRSFSQKLSSIEARPILWMVLFEWKNPNHLDKMTETNLRDLQLSLAHDEALFEMKTTSIIDMLDNQMSNMDKQSIRTNLDLQMGKVKLRVSSKHFRNAKNNKIKYPSANRFLRKLQDEFERDN